MATFIRSNVNVRRDYAKLNISTGLQVLSPSVGLTQYYKGGSFSPDHGATPLVLTPTVTAKADDITPQQVWTVGDTTANSGVGGKAWKVNGTAISSVWTEGTDFTLSDDGKTLYILKNIPVGSGVSVSCAILVYDSRTGLYIACETDPVPLSTVAAEDGSPMRLSIDQENVLWCPEADDLLEWDYRNARGYAQKMTQTAATNDSCYKKTVNLCVTQGDSQLTKGYGIWIYDSSNKTVAYITAGGTKVNNQPIKVLSLTTTAVTFDCRTIEDEWFTVYALDADGAIDKATKKQIHVHQVHRDYDAPEIVNHSDYTVKQTKYRNSLRVRCNGEEWDYPECYLQVYWRTQANSTNADEQDVGQGNECVFAPNEAGDGITATDNGFQMIADTTYHDTLAAATDGTNYWTDENGNVLLI